MTRQEHPLDDERAIQLALWRYQLIAELIEREDLARGEVSRIVREVSDLFEHGTREEQQQFVQLFVKEIRIDPATETGEIWLWKYPGQKTTTLAREDQGRETLVVAGAGFEPATFGL